MAGKKVAAVMISEGRESEDVGRGSRLSGS